MSVGLAIEFDRDGRVRPGQRVSGRIAVEKGGRSRALDVRAVRREVTSSEHVEVFSTDPQRLHEGRLESGARLPFEIEVPGDALPSYGCDQGKIFWAIVVRSDELGRDTTKVWSFVVESPR